MERFRTVSPRDSWGNMAIRAIAVEDDEAVSRLIAQVLTSHGFEVCGTAATGEDGVTLARRESRT